jgi:hypothetical protein
MGGACSGITTIISRRHTMDVTSYPGLTTSGIQRNSEVLTKLSRIPSSAENTSVTT